MKKKLMVYLMAAVVWAAGCGTNTAETNNSTADADSGFTQDAAEMENAAEQDDVQGEAASENKDAADQEMPYQIEMVSYQKDELRDIQYPRISGWENEQKQEEWNEMFAARARAAAGGATGNPEESPLGEKDAVSVIYTVQNQTDDLLSLTCFSYYNYEGAAHPSTSLDTYNINMQTGEKVTLADMADPQETAKRLFAEDGGLTVLSGPDLAESEITVKEILEYNFLWMEPTEDALAQSLSHFDGEPESYGENETMGCSYMQDGKICIVFYMSHAMGDYAVVQLD